MARQQSLAAETKAQVLATLRATYPESCKQFRLICKNWSTGGVVDVSWIDGPSKSDVQEVLTVFRKEGSVISLNVDRAYSFHFLSVVANRYCEAKRVVVARIHLTEETGHAHVDIYTETALYREIYHQVAEISSQDLEDVAFIDSNEQGVVCRTSLLCKQDFSEGLCEEYAVVGTQGYALMSGPLVRFDIYPVTKRYGAHRVAVNPYHGMGFPFRSAREAIPALLMLKEKGQVEALNANGDVIGFHGIMRYNNIFEGRRPSIDHCDQSGHSQTAQYSSKTSRASALSLARDKEGKIRLNEIH